MTAPPRSAAIDSRFRPTAGELDRQVAALAADLAGAVGDSANALAQARQAVARQWRLPDWSALTGHVAALDRETAAGAVAPDGDQPTVHLRCGSDIAPALVQAGFAGRFLELSDPLCQGPVPATGDLPAIRGRFIAGAYGPLAGLDPAGATARLRQQQQALAEAIAGPQRLVLWCEADSYDQLMLVSCLARAAAAARRPDLALIAIADFPGTARFIGLGQLPPAALRLLWPQRRPVTDQQLALGAAAWTALTAPTPESLAALAATGTPALPLLAPALYRHLQELPWTGDGLSLTERLVLRLAAGGGTTAGRLFGQLQQDAEPLPWLGDMMLWAIIDGMTRAGDPAIVIAPDDAALPWPHRRLVVTEAGQAVLAGRRDGRSLQPPDRWVGGILLAPGQPDWRWSPDHHRPVLA